MADDICHGCLMNEYSFYMDERWALKYMSMHWKLPKDLRRYIYEKKERRREGRKVK